MVQAISNQKLRLRSHTLSGDKGCYFQDETLLQQVEKLVLSMERSLSTVDSYLSATEELKDLQSLVGALKEYSNPRDVVSYLEIQFGVTGDAVTEKLMDWLKHLNEGIDKTVKPVASLNRSDLLYKRAVALRQKRLLHRSELPEAWTGNPFIYYGYRFEESYWSCTKSMFQAHNETFNIWSHMMGLAVVAYISFVHFPSTVLYASLVWQDKFIIYTFLAASAKCLTCSVLWHTYKGTCNIHHRSKFACVDYTGIMFLITASIITTEYAALYYKPMFLFGFILFSSLCGLVGLLLCWSPTFDRPELRYLRVGFFVSLCGLGASAGISLWYDKGLLRTLNFYKPVVPSILLYITGSLFYGSLFPEKLKLNQHPEFLWWIDYIMSSHNIWHIFVLSGIVAHYIGIMHLFAQIPLNAC